MEEEQWEEDVWNDQSEEDVEPTPEQIQEIDEDDEWLKSIRTDDLEIEEEDDDEDDQYVSMRNDPDLAGWIPPKPIKTPEFKNGAATYARDYLMSQGLPSHVAAGIVGNLVKESNLNPTVSERGNTGNGRGIAQWDVRDRWKDLQSFASKQGRSHTDLNTQLDFVVHEASQRGDLAKTMQARTPEEAAYIFGKHYERPNERYADWSGRQATAKALNKQYGGPVNNLPEDPFAGISDEALEAYAQDEGIQIEEYDPELEVEQSGSNFQQVASTGLQAIDKFKQVKNKLNKIGAGAAKSVSDAIDIQSEIAGTQRDASSMRKFNAQKNSKKYTINKTPLNQPLIYT